VSRTAAAAFGRFVLGVGFSIQRAGIMYGTVGDDAVVRVEAIYEPPQVRRCSVPFTPLSASLCVCLSLPNSHTL
jgi:hypothetical protein